MKTYLKKATILVLAAITFERCGDSFMKGKVKNESTATFELAATADAAGNYTAAIDPNSKSTQVLRASGDLAGSAIALPPGALGISLNITIGTGETLASNDVSQSLGLGSNSASAAGPAVSFVPSSNVQANSPFTLSIPVSSTSLALSALDNDNLIVMFKWMKVEKNVTSYEIGLIPRDQLTIGSKAVQFQTTKFGTFQLAVTQTKVTEVITKPTVEPPVLKADANNPLVGVWSQCYENSNGGGYNTSSTSTNTTSTTNTSGTNTSGNSTGSANSLYIDGPAGVASYDCAPFRVIARDSATSYAWPVSSAVSVTVSIAGGSGYLYTDATCSSGSSTTQVISIPAGQVMGTVFYSTFSGSVTSINISSASPANYTLPAANTSFNVYPTKLDMTGPETISKSTCSGPYLIENKDGHGASVNVGASTKAYLQGPPTITYFTDSSCTTAVSLDASNNNQPYAQLAPSTSSINIWLKDSQDEFVTLMAYQSGFGNGIPVQLQSGNPPTNNGSNASNGTAANTSNTSSTATKNDGGGGGGGSDHLGVPFDAKTFAREFVKFSASTFIHSRSMFTDANCSGTMLSKFEETGSYTLGAKGADSTYPIAITFATNMGTVYTQATADYANAHPLSNGCGLTDWTVNNPRDMSSSTCNKDPKSKSGPTKVKIQDNKIYFNDSGSATVNTKDSMTRAQ